MKNKVKEAWEYRSQKYESDPRGVLPKSYPVQSIKHLDDWMYGQIIPNLTKNRKMKVLDLGCGYGRLAQRVEDDFPSTSVDGIDISGHYVRLYNNNIKRGKAVVGDIAKLPFKNNTYDLVIIVTTLMYLTNKTDQQRALKEIFRVLKKGGKLILIERNYWGHQFVMLGGTIEFLRGIKNKEIGAVSFKANDLRNLIRDQKAEIISQNGNTLFCLTVHFQYLLSFLPEIFLNILLNCAKYTERLGKFNLTLPLYFSYTALSK